MKRWLPLCLVFLLCFSWGLSSAEKIVTLTLTGDVTLGGERRLAGQEGSFFSCYEQYGADYFFEKIRFLFEGDDITLINLEGTLTDSSGQENKKKYYRFSAPTAYVGILTGSSVEAANLANNHSIDYGQQGIHSTQRTLDENGIGFCMDQELFIWERDGIKIAFFGLRAATYQKNRDWCREKMAELREKEGVGAIVFSFHEGTEYAPNRNRDQEKMAKFAIEAGADLVVIHHPHVLQGIEIQNSRTILYSLGNLCFGGNRRVKALETMVVQAELHFSEEGRYLGQQLRLYPAHTSGTEPDSNYQPHLVTGEEAEQVLELVQADTDFELPPYSEEEGCVTLPYLAAEEAEPGF